MTCTLCKRDCPPPPSVDADGFFKKNKDAFSRRHWTNAALMDSREKKAAAIQAWEDTIADNIEARSERSASQQLAILDARLGHGKGAMKERRRLAKLMKKEKKNT